MTSAVQIARCPVAYSKYIAFEIIPKINVMAPFEKLLKFALIVHFNLTTIKRTLNHAICALMSNF